MPTIHDLRTRLTEARIEADRRQGVRTEAARAEVQAHRDALDHESASSAAKIFGRIPTRESRRHDQLAAECRAAMERHSAAQIEAAGPANEASAEVRHLEAQLERAERHIADEELDQEQQREAMAAQRVRDAVESDEMSAEEAYADDGLVRSEVHDREVRRLEAEDGLDDLWWSPADDGGYAEAAEEARQDQLAVRDADLSIDAGVRTHEEVYTPEGHIRQHLVRDEPEADTAPAPEPDRGRDAAPERDQRTAPDLGFDEPF